MPKSPKNKKIRHKTQDITSGSSSSSEEENIDFYIEDESGEELVMDEKEFKSYLNRLFPNAKNLDSKIKEMDKIDKKMDKEEKQKKKLKEKKEKQKEKKNNKPVSTTKEPKEEKKTKHKKNKKNKYVESSSEESDSEYNPYEEESEEEMDEEELKQLLKEGGIQMNLVFTMGGEGVDPDEYYIEYDSEEYETLTETEEDEQESEEEKEIITRSKSKKKVEKPKQKNSKSKKNKKSKKEKDVEETSVELDEESEYREILQELKKHIKGKNEKGRREVYEKLETMAIQEQEEIKIKEKRKNKKKQIKNTQKLKSLLVDKNIMNDFRYFEKMELEQQKKILDEVEKINKISRLDKPYRIKLLESSIPPQYKDVALKKINSLKYMEPGSGEYYKIKHWVDGFMSIPFGTYSSIPYSLKDNTIDEIHGFMETSKNTLNSIVYGLNDAKLQIMQIIGQWISNPGAIGNAIAIKGPMGTGKTTLVKEGVSKILNRPFAFIALGGATDSSFLEGHSYTYEGSLWGQIVDILMKSKSMNPVIYFDELDKVSDTPKGEEIIGILTHLTDTTQNSQFHDKYFANIDFDLSKVLFIFSYNHEEKVNPILKDRMYHIETKGYDNKEKRVIANEYLLPKIRENVSFEEGQIIIPDETLDYINTNLTNGERGVRNLKRCLETIYTKLNLFRLMKSDTNLFDKDISIKVEFPFTVTPEIIEKLVKQNKGEVPPYGMYT